MLVRLLVGRAVWVQPPAGNVMLLFVIGNSLLSVPLSTQVYKWVPANLKLEVPLRWTSIPSRGCRNTPSHVEPAIETNWGGMSTDLMGCRTFPRLNSKFFFQMGGFF